MDEVIEGLCAFSWRKLAMRGDVVRGRLKNFEFCDDLLRGCSLQLVCARGGANTNQKESESV